MKKRIVLFFAAFLIWILLSWSVDSQHLVVGAVVGILVSLLADDIFPGEPGVFKNPKRYLWFLYYIPVFIWECIKANIEGVFYVIHPDLPINPGIVKVKTRLRSDIGLTFLANSLTLTPGTMTVDIDRENWLLYVHWLNVKEQDIERASELIVRKFENILMRIFE
jgi:multicomponent Na+:H+ antiporter subunit E